MKTALVIGATGLVGKQLVQQLLTDERFGKVIAFSRRSLDIANSKLEEHLINFDEPDEWQHLVKGDVLFSTLGTTLKQAGGQNEQYKVDYYYQYKFAEAAAQNGVPTYVLVSSSGASPDSLLFYSRMKGTLEEAVKKLNFESIHIIQPGLLHGDRKDSRFGEELAYKVMHFLDKVGVAGKFRPYEDKVVAQAMINAAVSAQPGVHTHNLGQVFELAERVHMER
ncbi:NAD(P)H-binding protein [Pontibacter sp. SGAir0037]|uniref:NAD(P)H-binding protein n=1 Tax=Pontibacter sp. SGAir0037 TaxID=2571030 RepID=UPI0010CD3C5C|nr:NAD(P)H-binding protein [Pontibacter sp. SGAir0037]QCR21584.1 NADH-quinone oxidoreductase subunit F [Pontibacter sp. SGAir0037]